METEYILKVGHYYVNKYKEPEFSRLPWTISFVGDGMNANRYKDLSEVENIQNKIGGEIYRVTTTVEKLEC